jgi:hypothetical protein
MEYVLLVILLIFLVTQILDFLLKIFMPKSDIPVYEEIVNSFIRKEASIEILKWITERRNEKNTRHC